MEDLNHIFYGGDRVVVTATHLLCLGDTGTVRRWVHDNVYIVDNDNGHTLVLNGNEMAKEPVF